MQVILLVVTVHAYQYQTHKRRKNAYSAVSRLKKSKSIAAENAANATPTIAAMALAARPLAPAGTGPPVVLDGAAGLVGGTTGGLVEVELEPAYVAEFLMVSVHVVEVLLT